MERPARLKSFNAPVPARALRHLKAIVMTALAVNLTADNLPAGLASRIRFNYGRHLTMRLCVVVSRLVVAGCHQPVHRDLSALSAVRRAYPGAEIWSVENRTSSGEQITCGYAHPKDPAWVPNAFIWRAGRLLTPVEVGSIPRSMLAALCGPTYVAPLVTNPIP